MTEGETVICERELTYDGDFLVTETEREEGESRTWEYLYEGDALDRTVYSEENRLVRVSIHRTGLEEFDTIDEIYRDGQVALRVYFSDQRRVKEEVIRDGQVIHTRLFDAESEGEQ